MLQGPGCQWDNILGGIYIGICGKLAATCDKGVVDVSKKYMGPAPRPPCVKNDDEDEEEDEEKDDDNENDACSDAWTAAANPGSWYAGFGGTTRAGLTGLVLDEEEEEAAASLVESDDDILEL